MIDREPARPAWPPGGGGTARLARGLDWSATPLGPVEGWPGSLRTAADLVLASGQAMMLAWGREGAVLYNDALAAALGERHPGAFGAPLREMWPEAWERIAPLVRRVAEGGTARLGNVPPATARPGRRGEARWSLLCSPVRDEGGAVAGLLGVAVDTAPRLRAARAGRALRRSEARYRAILGTTGEGFAIVEAVRDGEGRTADLVYREVNPAYARLAGFRARPGQRVRDLLPDIEARWSELYDRVLRSGAPEHVEDTAADTGRWYRLTLARVGGPGSPLVSCALSDVTDQRAAGDTLRARAERQAFLLGFSDALRAERDADAVAGRALRLLVEEIGLDRCYVAAHRPEDDRADITHQAGGGGGVPPLPGTVRLSDFPDAWERVHGGTLVIDDLEEREGRTLSDVDRAGILALGVRAIVTSVARGDGRGPLHSLVAVSARARRWTQGEIALVEEAAERTWAAMERARAEAALRGREALFRAFAENSADTIWIAAGDGSRLEYLSPAYERMFGEPRDAVVADIRHWAAMVHPDDRAAAVGFMPRALAGETAVAHYRVVRPADGRVVHLRDTGFPILDGTGRVVRVAGIVQDVTDIASAGRALEEEKERFRTLAEGIPQLVWRSCARGLWTWSSPQWQAYTGQSQEESRGTGWLGAVHPDDRGAAAAAWERAGAHGRLEVEYRVRRASDGAWRWHQTRSVPVRDARAAAEPEGRILEWLGTSTEIEDLKRMQSEQAVLLAELQHRTRNLVAVIRNIARRSLGPSPERDTYDERLAAIGRVQGFLARSGGWSVPLRGLVRAELEAAGDAHPDRVEVEGPEVELPGDKAQTVALALHELATNAVKYGAIAQDGARLRVAWQVQGAGTAGGRLMLEWRESGVAMPAEPPARRGYGSELIERALPYQLQAETRREFTPDGVLCTISLPVDAFQLRDGAGS